MEDSVPAEQPPKEEPAAPKSPEAPDPARDDSSKFDDNVNYIVKPLTSVGLPMVLRSEVTVPIEEDVISDVGSILEENDKIKDSLSKSGRKVAESDEYLLRSAAFHYLSGNPQKALDIYDRILGNTPTKMAALYNKGVVLDSTGNYSDALQFFDRALSRVPENVHVLSNKGITLYKDEKYQQALECLEAALKVDSSYVNALTFRSHALYRHGRNMAALVGYNRVIRRDRNNAEALYNKACLCSLKGDEYGAITSLEKAIRLDPSWKDAARQDADLERVRKSPRFSVLLK